jgi:hypothetical protein
MLLIACGFPSEYFLPGLRARLLPVIERALADLKPATAAHRFAGSFAEGFAFNRVGEKDRDVDLGSPWRKHIAAAGAQIGVFCATA